MYNKGAGGLTDLSLTSGFCYKNFKKSGTKVLNITSNIIE